MPLRQLHNERGIALAVAVFALVVIGVLVSATFFLGRLEQRTGGNLMYAGQAAEAAETGLNYAITQADPAVYEALPIYVGDPNDELVYATQSLAGRLAHTTSVRRLNNELFLVQAFGERQDAGGQALATHRLGRVMRLFKPTFSVNAAVTVSDPVKFNGNSFAVSGINAVPSGWTDCDPARADNLDDMVGVRSATGTGVSGQDYDNIEGYPVDDVAYDPTVTSATFQDFVDQTYASMSAAATKTLPSDSPYDGAPEVDAGACDKTVLTNFGEPRRPGVTECYGYFPVVHGTGTRTKFSSGGVGQGTLLVDGDLELTGGFEWSGLIIVRGSVNIAGTGNKITGALLAESVTEDNSISGNVEIHYSSCAVEKAVLGAATPLPVNQRAWMQLY